MASSVTDAQGVGRLCSLGINAALEDGLRAVLASGTTSPRDALRTFIDFLGAHSVRCGSAAVEEFKRQIIQLERRGFDADVCSLFFAVPNEQGQLIDLFPGGGRVAVRACNYANFRSLLSLFVDNGSEVNPAYIELARVHVPVRADENLMSDAYGVILDLIDNHLLSEHSPWNITVNAAAALKGRLEKSIWEVYGLTEHVPFRGRLFSVRADFYPPGKVAQDKAFSFVDAARERLSQLACTDTEHLTMSFADPLSTALSIYLYGEDSAESQIARLNNSVLLVTVDPYVTRTCTDTFEICIGPRRFALCEGGERELLRPHNTREFARLYLQKRLEISQMTKEVIDMESAAESKPSSVSQMRLETCPPHLSQQWNTTRLQPGDADIIAQAVPEPLKQAHEQGALTKAMMAQLPAFFAVAVGDGVYRLIPNGEHIPVTLNDVGELITRVEHLMSLLKRGAISYSGNGSASPSGQHNQNRAAAGYGLVARRTSIIENARRGEGVIQGLTAAPSVPNGSALGNRAQSAPSAAEWHAAPLRVSAAAAPVSSLFPRPAVPPSQQFAWPAAAASPRAAAAGKDWLTKDDLPAMEELDRQLHALGEDQSKISPEAWAETKCTWVVYVPGTSVVMPLFDGGSRQLVELQDIGKYVSVAREALRSARAVIEDTGSFPPPADAHTFQDPIQQSRLAARNAVPQSPTEHDRALFSPTHEVNNLFAPIERLN